MTEERERLAAQHLAARARASQRTARQRVRLTLLQALGLLWGAGATGKEPTTGAIGPSSILVIRPDHLGDLLFAVPALRRLRAAYPYARITALVGPWGEPVLARTPYVDDILTCPFPGFLRMPKGSFLAPYRTLWYHALALRARRFDLALILRFDHWWGALLAALAGIPWRVGYDVAEVKPSLTSAVPYRPGRHEVIQNLALLSGMVGSAMDEGITWREEPLEFALSDADKAWARDYLGQDDDKGWIAFHPGAGAAVKRWRAEAWAEVGDALAARFGARIVITGSVGERPLAEEIARRLCVPARIAAGETTLPHLAALLHRCRLVIGPDSGPLHLAVAVGTPTVHLYGPVDAALFGPWGDPQRHRVVRSAWACVPCNRLDYADKELPLHGCVRDISVGQVVAAAEEAWQ